MRARELVTRTRLESADSGLVRLEPVKARLVRCVHSLAALGQEKDTVRRTVATGTAAWPSHDSETIHQSAPLIQRTTDVGHM